MIPKGPDKELEQKILTLLYEADKEAQIPWQEFIDIAQECIEIFMDEGFKKKIRSGKKNELSKLPSQDLNEIIQRLNLDSRITTPGSFYAPFAYYTEGADQKFFNDSAACDILEEAVSPNFFLPPDSYIEDPLGVIYALSLKKALHLLSQEENPPLLITLRLINFLYKIHEKAILLKHRISKAETRINIGIESQKKNPNSREVRFETLKKYYEPGLNDHRVRDIIRNVLTIKDPPSVNEYLAMWRWYGETKKNS